ncbi:MAG: hypothetical protein EAZ53_09250 [Bacteroidetes bacterium]|nr:MAG: hypothetical protein EAZ53_09250 [Bacteroidota bacterium]
MLQKKVSPSIQNILNQLELKDSESLVFFQKQGWNTLISKETEYKFEVIKPTAFYVFNKLPYILFFDLTNNTNPEKEKEIYKQVWSFDQAPVIFIIKGNEIQAFNAFELEINGILKEINLEEAIKECSFWNLQSGATLEWFYTKYQKDLTKKRVNQRLFDNIKQTISLLENEKLDSQIAKILVLRLIFVRYLIDRNIKIDTQYISGDTILDRRKSFSKLLKNPKELKSFFVYLDERFNGVLFKENNDIITQNQADIISSLFDPSLENSLLKDTNYWFNLFDFGIIPVELISGIYETLLDPLTKDATSAVYTPPFLVDYILTQTVDKHLQNNITECKIFDPAMGSGIFLVQAFRRIVDAEIAFKNKSIITKARLAEIAENNLYGIDVNEEAIKVACFSIYVALLDYLEPADIDDIDHRFPTLQGTNFFKVHFFDLSKENILQKIKSKKLDFILGNPPWRNNDSPEHLDWLKKTKFDKIVSDKQIAQSYLLRVKDFAENSPKIAFIVTSKVVYNNKAKKFRKFYLENNKLSECFDLSPVRHLVFEDASNPAMILFFESTIGNFNPENVVKHISIKQNKFFNKYFKTIVIEKFDQKKILQKHFLENDWMFKVALYGNTLDYLFLRKQINYERIKSILKNKKIKFSKGIFKGTPKKHFEELIGMPYLIRKEFKDYYTNYINSYSLINNETCFLEAGRTIDLFKGKKIILQKSISENFKISLIDFDCIFDSTVYGINYSHENTNFISIHFSFLLSNFYLYYQFLTSSSLGVYIPEIYKEEHVSFPYKEPSESQKQTLIALVNKLLQPYQDFYASYPDSTYSGVPNPAILKEINEIIYEIYDVRPFERDLIDYVLNVSRYQFQDSKQDLVFKFSKNENDIRNQKQVLEQYIAVFLEDLTQIYYDEYIEIEVYQLEHFIALNFKFDESKTAKPFINWETKEKTENDFFKKMSNLSISKLTSATDLESNLFIQKDIKGFEENSFYIIKPNEYKCWLRAMARYDVSEIKEAIQAAELGRIKSKSLHE